MTDTPSLNVYKSGPVFEEIKKGRLVGTMVDMDGMNDVTVYYCNPKSKVTIWFACCLCGDIIKNAHAVPKHGKTCTIPNPTNTKQRLIEVMPSVDLLDGDFGTIPKTKRTTGSGSKLISPGIFATIARLVKRGKRPPLTCIKKRCTRHCRNRHF